MNPTQTIMVTEMLLAILTYQLTLTVAELVLLMTFVGMIVWIAFS